MMASWALSEVPLAIQPSSLVALICSFDLYQSKPKNQARRLFAMAGAAISSFFKVQLGRFGKWQFKVAGSSMLPEMDFGNSLMCQQMQMSPCFRQKHVRCASPSRESTCVPEVWKHLGTSWDHLCHLPTSCFSFAA